MKKYQDYMNKFNISSVFQTRIRLNDMRNYEGAIETKKRRNKWVAAAVIALASGSTVA